MNTVKYLNRAFLAVILIAFGLSVVATSGTLTGIFLGLTLPLAVVATATL